MAYCITIMIGTGLQIRMGKKGAKSTKCEELDNTGTGDPTLILTDPASSQNPLFTPAEITQT